MITIKREKKSRFQRAKDYVTRNPFTAATGVIALSVAAMSIPSFEAQSSTTDKIENINVVVEYGYGDMADPMGHTTSKSVDYKAFKNRPVGPLVGTYLGVTGAIPSSIEVNYADQLQNAWDRKLRIKGVTGATRSNSTKIVEAYRSQDPGITNVKDFVGKVDLIVKENNANLNFNGVCKQIRLNDDECFVLSEISNQIEGRHIVAYGMTELFPLAKDDFNYILLDTILRNAGERYLQSIPALGDPLMSFGFYQFTSYAVRHDEEAIEGANLVSRHAAAPYKIPGSVAKLEMDDNHRAAHYFAVYNIGRLVDRLDSKGRQTLLSGKCSMDELTEFVATSHHMPAPSRRRATSWIKGGCKKPLVAYMGNHLSAYAQKTRYNLDTLERHKL